MKKQHSHPVEVSPSGLRSWVAPLAIALALVIGLETVAMAATTPQTATVVYNGKCPGDKDDDCKS